MKTPWFFCLGAFAVVFAATADDRASVETRIRRGYSIALDESKVVRVSWTMFGPKAPLAPSPAAASQANLVFRDPVSNSTVEAVKIFRAWCTGGEKVRIEWTTPFVLGGPEAMRWSVRASGEEYHVSSETLSARRAEVTPVVSLDPKVDDLFADAEAHCLGLIAHRLVVWVQAEGTSVQSDGPDAFVLTTAGGPVRIDWVPGTDQIRSVRYRLKAAPKDAVVEYQGILANSVYPAPHPATSRLSTVEPNEPPGPIAWVVRYDSIEVVPETDPTRYTWQSIATSARRTDTNTVLRKTGEVDTAKTFATRTQQTFEPLKHTEDLPKDGNLPKAIDKTPAWSRWLLVGGITSIVLAVGLVLRRRAGA